MKMEYYKCKGCGQLMPLTAEYYYKHSKTANGFRSKCKRCLGEQNKKWVEENKDKRNAISREYAQRNKEKMAKQRHGRYEKNIAKMREISKNNYYNNIEYHKKYYQDNKEKILERTKQYRKENRVAITQRVREYRRSNPGKAAKAIHTRRARLKKVAATLTAEQWGQIKEDFNYKCAYCGEEKPLEQEHFIPLSKGGEYTHNNIITCCRNCNPSKGNRDFFEWYPKQDFYDKKREKFILQYLGYAGDVQQLSFGR